MKDQVTESDIRLPQFRDAKLEDLEFDASGEVVRKDRFEKWFMGQDFYTNMRFIHGDALFTKDGDVYRVLPVQMTHVAWVEKQSETDQLKKQLNTANFFKKGDDSTVENATKVMNEMRGQIQKLQKERDQLKAEKAGLEKTIQDALEVIASKIVDCRITENIRNFAIGQQNTAFLIREELQVLEEVLRGANDHWD